MPGTPLSNIQERVERSIYESIRLEIVDKGYLPDIADDISFPKTASGALTEAGNTAWRTAQQAIKDDTTKGFTIELFNFSSAQAKGLKQVPRIVIIPLDFVPGTLGGDETRYHTKNQADWSVARRPPQTSDFTVQIALVGNSAKQMRILKGIIQLAMPRRGYVKVYDNPDDVFLVLQQNFVNEPDNAEGVLEKLYLYEIPDLYETLNTPLGNVASIAEITVDQYIGDPDNNEQVDGIQIPD